MLSFRQQAVRLHLAWSEKKKYKSGSATLFKNVRDVREYIPRTVSKSGSLLLFRTKDQPIVERVKLITIPRITLVATWRRFSVCLNTWVGLWSLHALVTRNDIIRIYGKSPITDDHIRRSIHNTQGHCVIAEPWGQLTKAGKRNTKSTYTKGKQPHKHTRQGSRLHCYVFDGT